MYAILEAINVLDIAKEMVRAAATQGNGGEDGLESGAGSLEPMVPPPRYEGGGAGDEQILEYNEPQYQARRGLRGGRQGRREGRSQY